MHCHGDMLSTGSTVSVCSGERAMLWNYEIRKFIVGARHDMRETKLQLVRYIQAEAVQELDGPSLAVVVHRAILSILTQAGHGVTKLLR